MDGECLGAGRAVRYRLHGPIVRERVCEAHDSEVDSERLQSENAVGLRGARDVIPLGCDPVCVRAVNAVRGGENCVLADSRGFASTAVARVQLDNGSGGERRP